MEIRQVTIDSLVLDPANARKHNKKNLEAIKGSLAKFGQQKPIVVDKHNVVIAGNGTLEAARSLGWDSINIVQTQLEGVEAQAFALADNRAGELAEWDLDNLGPLLKSLNDMDFDLSAIGFDENDLTKMVPEQVKEGLIDDDEIPEVTETRCKPGDLWQLGPHRLLCGDSTNIQHVERLMGGEKADMVFTDPPYGVNEETDRAFASRTRKAKGNSFSKIIGDDSIDTAVAAYSIANSLSEIVCYWGGNYYAHKFGPSACWVVWDKRVEENQRDMNSDCELAYVKHPNKKSVRIFRHLWKGMIKASEHGQGRIHPTQKPIALAEWCFKELAIESLVILDLFLGSGSTLIACEKTNRRCFGMEIDPHYCSVILARWEKFTGKVASLLAEK